MSAKKHICITGALAAAAWCGWRDRKYPLARGYWLLNKFAVPGFFLSGPTLRLANKCLRGMKLPAPLPGVKRRTVWIDAWDGKKLRLTLYMPEAVKEALPCLVYFHGGGFCLEDAPYIHATAAEYAKLAECMVALVHYRTSDQYPFPVPFLDCCSGLEYIQTCGKTGIDRTRIAVGGDSVGGALAAACTLWNRKKGMGEICFQMLIYPVLDARMGTDSMRKYTDSPIWNARLTERMWRLYLKDEDHGMQNYASPACEQELHDLPPAYIEAEEFDCLHDEGISYANRLKACGVPVHLEDVKGTFHGFDVFHNTEISRKMIHTRGMALHRAFWGKEKQEAKTKKEEKNG